MLNKYYFGPGEQYNSLNEVIEAINSSVINDEVIIYAAYQSEPYRLIDEIVFNHNFKTTITSKDERVIFTGKEILPNNTFIKAIEDEEPDNLVKVWKCIYNNNYIPDIYENNVLLERYSDYESVYRTPGSYCIIDNYLYIHASDSSKVRINDHLYEIVTRDFIIKSSNNIEIHNIDFEHSKSFCIQLSGNHIFRINKCRFRSNYGSIRLSNSENGFIIENNSFINDAINISIRLPTLVISANPTSILAGQSSIITITSIDYPAPPGGCIIHLNSNSDLPANGYTLTDSVIMPEGSMIVTTQLVTNLWLQ